MGQSQFSVNAFENIKKYFNKKKVERYKDGGKNSLAITIVDIFIVLLFIVTFYYIYFINEENMIKISGYVAIAVFAAFCIVKIVTVVLNNEKAVGGVTRIVLVDDSGKSLRTWTIGNKISFLIGKSTKQNEVDIDLTSTEYSELISRQHAVLNYAEGTWFIEDLGSRNGSGIQRINETEKYKIESGKLYKLNAGDAIYIANTKIILK